MGSRIALLGVLAGCSFDPNVATEPEATIDAHVGPDCTSFSQQLDTCALPPGASLILSGALHYDTNTGLLFAGASPIPVTSVTLSTTGGEIEAIVATSVTLVADAALRADGARPFAIIAGDTITLADRAVIDVSAGGAGARSACPSSASRGGDQDGGAGGGGGGGFGGAGGIGGVGNDDGSPRSIAGTGGVAVATPLGPIGGCPGAAGGNDNNDDGGAGGAGGGAVYLVAARRIELVSGSGIQAGGGGGGGGHQSGLNFGDAGGGGGGSGGMILLEAPIVATKGTLAANGGGGGEGSGAIASGNSGQPGQLATARADGGNGKSSGGGNGGLGGAKTNPAGDPVTATAPGGGGGGGGGAGVIRIESPAPDLNAAVSPPPS